MILTLYTATHPAVTTTTYQIPVHDTQPVQVLDGFGDVEGGGDAFLPQGVQGGSFGTTISHEWEPIPGIVTNEFAPIMEFLVECLR